MGIPGAVQVLTDGVVTLRGPRPEDVAGAVERYSEDANSSHGADDARRWIEFGMAEAWARGHLVFVVEYQGRYAGSVGLKPDSEGSAEVHFGLAHWARGAGVAARAVRLALGFGFETCGFSVIRWYASVENSPSRRVAWATGFRLGPAVPDLVEYGGRRTAAFTGWIGPDDAREPRQAWIENPML